MMFFQYISWHFYDVPGAIIRAWRDFIYFILNYFSVPALLKTFFSHWHRYFSSYGKGFNPKRFVETLVLNTMSRVIGMLFRTVFILLGVLAEAVVFILGLIALLLWLILPFLLIAGFIFGLKLIFNV